MFLVAADSSEKEVDVDENHSTGEMETGNIFMSILLIGVNGQLFWMYRPFETILQSISGGLLETGKREPIEERKKSKPPNPHLLQVLQALVLPVSKLVGRPRTESYPAPSPDPTIPIA